MNSRSIAPVAALAAWLVLLAAPAPAQSASSPGPGIVDRAASYAVRFLTRFSHIVAQERYVQRGSGGRNLVADIALVKTAEDSRWRVFRDVIQVNGQAVRDRQARLERLFVDSPETALARAEQITQESARYNIPPPRTINNPLLVIAFLQDAYRSRFTFSTGKRERIEDRELAVVEFAESGRPTLIRGSGGRDVPANGRFWVEDDGSIVRTRLETKDATQQGAVTVTFRPDERFQLLIPVRMEEEYFLRSGVVTAVATYDNFRSFAVKTEERLR